MALMVKNFLTSTGDVRDKGLILESGRSARKGIGYYTSVFLGFPCGSAGKESACNAGDLGFDTWVGKIRWRRERLPTPVFLGFSCGSAGKESTCNEGDLGSIPGLGRSPGEGKSYPLQYSGLENPMDCIVPGVTESDSAE